MLLSWGLFFCSILSQIFLLSSYEVLSFSHGLLCAAFEATFSKFSFILLMCSYRFFQKCGSVLAFLFVFMDPDLPLLKWMETTAINCRLSGIRWFPHPKRHPYLFSILHLSFHEFFFLWVITKMSIFLLFSGHFTQPFRMVEICLWGAWSHMRRRLPVYSFWTYFSSCTLSCWSSYSCILLTVPWHSFLRCVFLGNLSNCCFLLHPSYQWPHMQTDTRVFSEDQPLKTKSTSWHCFGCRTPPVSKHLQVWRN